MDDVLMTTQTRPLSQATISRSRRTLRLAGIWEQLTGPASRITDPTERRQSRLISAALILLLLILVIGEGYTMWSLLLPIVVVALAYPISRMGFYRIAGMAAMLSLSYPSFMLLIETTAATESNQVAMSISWLLLPIVVSTLILPPMWTAVTLMVNMGAVVLIRYTVFPDLFPVSFVAGTTFVFTVTIILLLVGLVRENYLMRPQLERLRRMHQRLETKNNELHSANREVKDFAYIVAHDLRAPLVNIDGFIDEVRLSIHDTAQLVTSIHDHLGEAERNQFNDISSDLREALDFIEVSTRKMDHLTQQVLNLAREGRRNLTIETVDVRMIVQEIFTTLSRKLDQNQAHVEIGHLTVIEADRLAVEQIMNNLLDNAVKYLDPQRPGIIHVMTSQNENEIVLQIQDNGRGIAPGDYEKVFQLFRRAGDNHDTPGEGMGLAYVQSLVRRHGGRVWFDSVLDQGTTFYVSFPIQTTLSEDLLS